MIRMVTAFLLLALTEESSEENGCYSPAKGAHSIANFSMPIQSIGMYPVDTVVTYHCDAGYENLTPIPRICLSNGSWTGNSPYCGLNVASTAQVTQLKSWNGYEYVIHDANNVLQTNGYQNCSYYSQGSASWKIILNQTKIIRSIQLTILLSKEAENTIVPDVLMFIWKNFAKVPVQTILIQQHQVTTSGRFYMVYEYSVINSSLTEKLNVKVRWPLKPLLFCSISIFSYSKTSNQIISSLLWNGESYYVVPRTILSQFNSQCYSPESGARALVTVPLQNQHLLQRLRLHTLMYSDLHLEPSISEISLTNFTAHELIPKKHFRNLDSNADTIVYEYELKKSLTTQQLYVEVFSAQIKISLCAVSLVEGMDVDVAKGTKVYNVAHLTAWEKPDYKKEDILADFTGHCALFGAGKSYWEIDLLTHYNIGRFSVIIRAHAYQNDPNLIFAYWNKITKVYVPQNASLIDRIEFKTNNRIYIKLTYSLLIPQNLQYFTINTSWSMQGQQLHMCNIGAYTVRDIEVRLLGKVSSAVIWNKDQYRVPENIDNLVSDWSRKSCLHMEAGEKGAVTIQLNSVQTISKLSITVSTKKLEALSLPVITFGTFEGNPERKFHLVDKSADNLGRYVTYEFVAEQLLAMQLVSFDFNLSGNSFFLCSIDLYNNSDENVAVSSQVVSSKNGLHTEDKQNVLNGNYEQCSSVKGNSWSSWTILLNKSYPIDRFHLAVQVNQSSDPDVKPKVVLNYPEIGTVRDAILLGQFSRTINENLYTIYKYSVPDPVWVKNLTLSIYWPMADLTLCDISIYTSLTVPEEFCKMIESQGKHLLFQKKCYFLSEGSSKWLEANESCHQLGSNGSLLTYNKDEYKSKMSYFHFSITKTPLQNQKFWINEPSITKTNNNKCLRIFWKDGKLEEESLGCVVPTGRICEYDIPVCGTPDQNRFGLMKHDLTDYAYYSCPLNFRIVGAPVRRCAGGRWFPQAPNCEPQDGTSGHINQFCQEEEQNLISFIRNTTIQVVLAFLLVQWTFVGFRIWYLKRRE